MVGEKFPKGLDSGAALFIMDEHELRMHEDLKKQSRPGLRRSPIVVTTGNIEEIREQRTGEAREAERKTHREALVKKFGRLQRQIVRLERLFKKGKK